MKPIAICGPLALLTCILLLSGCAYPTPRYDMFKGVELPEDEIALLQIPHHTRILLVDGKEPTAGVRDHFLAELIAGHLYRETTLAAGLHTIEYHVSRAGGASVTVFQARAGHTYRIQMIASGRDLWSWIEEVPEILEPLHVRVFLAKRERQRREWDNHRWRRLAAGLNKRRVEHLSLEELHQEAVRYLSVLDQFLPSHDQ